MVVNLAIGEKGGLNLYAFAKNSVVFAFDMWGLKDVKILGFAKKGKWELRKVILKKGKRGGAADMIAFGDKVKAKWGTTVKLKCKCKNTAEILGRYLTFKKLQKNPFTIITVSIDAPSDQSFAKIQNDIKKLRSGLEEDMKNTTMYVPLGQKTKEKE